MDQGNRRHCLFMGLPNSGKSTFIGALWHVLESKEIPSTLVIEAEPENREYLNKLRDAWLRFEAPGRTSAQVYNPIEFLIKEKERDAVINFTFPDLSGEMYESQFEHRSLSPDYYELIKSCEGILLFINPDFMRSPNLITDVDEMQVAFDTFFQNLQAQTDKQKKASPNVSNEESNAENAAAKDVKWQHKYSQTQVKIIDLLQMASPLLKMPCKIAFVISAWDVIMEANKVQAHKDTPSEWLEKRVPLLRQYLASNPDVFIYEVFGISAQGGSYKEGKVEELYKVPLPSERVVVQHENEIGQDITVPIKWLLNE